MDEIVESDFDFGDYVPPSVGPEQFVNLISNAAFVCTDSFHGTVFSILYHKTFFTFDRYKSTGGDSTNSRLNSILEICGLESRKRQSEEGVPADMLCEIDYSEVEKRISELRRESVDYLIEALTEE